MMGRNGPQFPRQIWRGFASGGAGSRSNNLPHPTPSSQSGNPTPGTTAHHHHPEPRYRGIEAGRGSVEACIEACIEACNEASGTSGHFDAVLDAGELRRRRRLGPPRPKHRVERAPTPLRRLRGAWGRVYPPADTPRLSAALGHYSTTSSSRRGCHHRDDLRPSRADLQRPMSRSSLIRAGAPIPPRAERRQRTDARCTPDHHEHPRYHQHRVRHLDGPIRRLL